MIIKWFSIALTVGLTFLQFDQSRKKIKWTAFSLCLLLLLLSVIDIWLSDRDQKKIEATLARASSRIKWENSIVKVTTLNDIKYTAPKYYQTILRILPNRNFNNINMGSIIQNSEQGPDGCKQLREFDAAKIYNILSREKKPFTRDEEFNQGIETIFFSLNNIQTNRGFNTIFFKHGYDYHLRSNYTSSYDLNDKIIVARIRADTGTTLTMSGIQIDLDTQLKPSTIAVSGIGDIQHGAAQFDGVKYVGIYIPKEFFRP